MKIIVNGRKFNIPNELFISILTWCIGGPDDPEGRLGEGSNSVLSLRLVSREMKALVSAMSQEAWNRPIRNLGLFMVTNVAHFYGLKRKRARRALHEDWSIYALVAYRRRTEAYLVQVDTDTQINWFWANDVALQLLGPAHDDRVCEKAWMLGHLHRCNAMRLIADPTDWSQFWDARTDTPTRLGRQLLRLEAEGYRPTSPSRDRHGEWSGFGILLVPRTKSGKPRYLEGYEAFDGTDLTQGKLLLEFFIRKILEDGTLTDSFKLPLPDSSATDRVKTVLRIDAPHSTLVPSYWPRSGWSHGLDAPPSGGATELFAIVKNPCKQDQVDIIYSTAWGVEAIPESKDLTTSESGKDVEDLVWTCELPDDSSPCQLILAYLQSAVKNSPYRTVEKEAARLKHDGHMNPAALWDWARGNVTIFDFNENRYEITQVRVIYSPRRWNAYLKYKTEHEPADLSRISWAGEQQMVKDFKFPLSYDEGECFLVHGTAFKTMKLIARGGFGPSFCKHRFIGGYGSIGQGSYLTDNLAKISTYANCPSCDINGAPCDCVDTDGKPLERVAIISRVFIPKDVKFTTEKKKAYMGDPLTKHPDRAMVIGLAAPHGEKATSWPNNVFLLRHPDMAYPELLVYFRWYKEDIH